MRNGTFDRRLYPKHKAHARLQKTDRAHTRNPSARSVLGESEKSLPQNIQNCLLTRDIHLYSHQAEAINKARDAGFRRGNPAGLWDFQRRKNDNASPAVATSKLADCVNELRGPRLPKTVCASLCGRTSRPEFCGVRHEFPLTSETSLAQLYLAVSDDVTLVKRFSPSSGPSSDDEALTALPTCRRARR